VDSHGEELLDLARADIGISVALEHAEPNQAQQLRERQVAIRNRIRELQRDILRVEATGEATSRRARPGTWLRVPPENRWGPR
jgi:hypothetical protein